MHRLDWTGKYEACINCGTRSYPERHRGLCARCFPAAEAIRKISGWDRDRTETWKGCPYRGSQLSYTRQYLDACERAFKNILKDRRSVEFRVRGRELLPSHNVEVLLRALADRLSIRNRKSFYLRARLVNGIAPNALRIIYRLADDLLFLQPGRSVWIDVMQSRRPWNEN
jgi:ribosomal protein L37E